MTMDSFEDQLLAEKGYPSYNYVEEKQIFKKW